MAGYRTWTPGEVLTASNVQNYLQDQTVMIFSSTAARGSAIVSPEEGMLTYITDQNRYEFWNGASWDDLVFALGTGGDAGQALVSAGTAAVDFGDTNSKYISTDISVKTAAYTAVAGDANTILNFTSAATVTIPDVLSQAGDMIQIVNNSSGTVSIVAGTGVTSWAGVGTAGTAVSFLMDSPYTAAGILKTANNEYRVLGKVVV